MFWQVQLTIDVYKLFEEEPQGEATERPFWDDTKKFRTTFLSLPPTRASIAKAVRLTLPAIRLVVSTFTAVYKSILMTVAVQKPTMHRPFVSVHCHLDFWRVRRPRKVILHTLRKICS